MTDDASLLILVLTPLLADGELHRRDLLAQARAHQDARRLRAPRRGLATPSGLATGFDRDAGRRAVAAAEDLVRRHQRDGHR
jgi:hypothetical protein